MAYALYWTFVLFFLGAASFMIYEGYKSGEISCNSEHKYHYITAAFLLLCGILTWPVWLAIALFILATENGYLSNQIVNGVYFLTEKGAEFLERVEIKVIEFDRWIKNNL